jgi:hypothetical protein
MDDSGSSYYEIRSEPKGSFLRARYRPPAPTVKLGFEVTGSLRNATTLAWRWRVHRFPVGADERVDGKSDSAGAVYCVFESGWRTYTLKYVYSAVVPSGTEFRDDPSFFHRMAVVVVSQADRGKTPAWRPVRVDFRRDVMRVFELKEAPRLSGVGLMTDGDGTNSEVSTDYAGFVLSRGPRRH